MTTDEVQALILKIQYLDRTRPRAARLIVELVEHFLDRSSSEPPADEIHEEKAGGISDARI
jgi:hypothetical protein